MRNQALIAPGSKTRVLSVERVAQEWVVSASGPGHGECPACGRPSSSPHSRYWRTLRHLPLQGAPVVLRVRVTRLRCRHGDCPRHIFAERLPGLAPPLFRRTSRVVDLLHALGHTAGGKPAERLLSRLGLPASDDTVLRHLKSRARARERQAAPRVVGIDDWAARKGYSYGTIMVDLEHRQVIDVLAERSAASTTAWLRDRPNIEVISRDRHGLYAEGARSGAPQAIQVADRFHLLQNLRERIEQHLGRLGRPIREGLPAAAEAAQNRAGLHRVREDLFARVRALYDAGRTVTAICQELGLSRQRVDRWVKLQQLPPRNAIASTPSSPAHFREYLRRRWKEGCHLATRLFTEIKERGYTGCYTHLARLLAPWRRTWYEGQSKAISSRATPVPLPRDPTTGRPLSPLTAAALCIKPRASLSSRQSAVVDTMKTHSKDFAIMRALAMRFRGILRSGDTEGFRRWLKDAHDCGVHALRRFARMLQGDIDAVESALRLPWSNGQTEGQINRLKTLKRAMYGSAGVELLRARLLPL